MSKSKWTSRASAPFLIILRAGAHAVFIIIIIDNFCIALFSGVHKLTALYNILQHFLSIFKVSQT